MTRTCLTRTGICILLAAVAPLASVRAQQGASRYALDDWMTVTSVSSFVLAPDGRSIYYTSNAGSSGTTEIFRVSVDGGAPVQLTTNLPGVRPEPKAELAISTDGETLYYSSARYFQGYNNLFRVPTTGGPSTALTFNDAVIETAPAPSPDGRTLAYLAHVRAGTQIFLLDLDQATSWPRPLAPASDGERSPVWSPDGRSLAFSRGGDIWIRTLDGGSPRRLIEDAYAGGNRSPVWSPDGGRIAFLTSKSGYAQVGVADVTTGSVTPITRVPREHSALSWSPDGRWVAFVQADEIGMSTHVVVAPADGSPAAKSITDGKGVRRSPRFLPHGSRLVYIEATGNRTADLWVRSMGGGAPRQITNSMGRIDPADMSVPEEITYPGPDNLPIPALLYLPKDFDPGTKYPVIVRLHGHPGQWNHSMSMEWQYFIQRGFVLIAPNPRGSRGFGQGFHDLHIADYGGVEFQDVMNVLGYLEGLGYVDMSRKATWGGSGGGYMSFVVATEAPDAFQAQVIRAPVSSWKHLAIDRYGASGRHWTATRTPRRERSEFGGSYDEIPEEYERRSPINFVESVIVPQLLFQGLRDASVPPRQSQMWVERMKELGKAALIEYVEYPDEDHGLRRYRATVRDRLIRMERFFAEHLGQSKP
ncbi:MAG: prolyl oligopeptidase family serine peptidase [Gemmatimonadetes bacterium]|nr:prolyl oligopeptidase family serine peptidase [Gemmatimonadota bacterium]